MTASVQERAVREAKSTWIAAAVVAAMLVIGGWLFLGLLQSLLPTWSAPPIFWPIVGALVLYYLWRKFSGRSSLKPHQIALIFIAAIAVEAALDGVLWGFKAALLVAALVLVLAAFRRTGTTLRP